MKAIVHATGLSTFFGKAADLVNRSEKKSHIHLVLKSIAYFCIIFIMVGVVAELITQFAIRGKPCTGVSDGDCAPLNNILVLVVGGLPIAMPTVLSVTMALGASALAKKKAIVSRLTVVEEIAGMEILCSDKTGTLTKNELSVKDPVAYVGDLADVIFDAALAAKPENGDAIDIAMVASCTDEQRELLKQFKTLHFQPFDPVGKKTVAKIQSPEGEVFHTTKGAPQVILGLAENGPKIRKSVLAVSVLSLSFPLRSLTTHTYTHDTHTGYRAPGQGGLSHAGRGGGRQEGEAVDHDGPHPHVRPAARRHAGDHPPRREPRRRGQDDHRRPPDHRQGDGAHPGHGHQHLPGRVHEERRQGAPGHGPRPPRDRAPGRRLC